MTTSSDFVQIKSVVLIHDLFIHVCIIVVFKAKPEQKIF